MTNERINDILIGLSHSLLHYVGETWPWTSENERGVREQLHALITQQQHQVAKLATYLSNQGHIIDFGTYPTEYTDLQYLSLDYLLKRLIEDQEYVLKDIQTAAQDPSTDAGARSLLQQIEAGVAQTIGTLRDIARKAS